MKILVNMWKFTETNADISESLAYKAMEYAENGDIKEFKKAYKELSKQSFGAEYLRKGTYKLMGYHFNFTPFLKKFLVKYKYNDYYSVIYALNKTNIFDNNYTQKSEIVDILEDTRHVIEF